MISENKYNNIDGLRVISCICIIIMHIRANTAYEISGVFFNKYIPFMTEFVYLFLIISGFGMCCGYYEKFKRNEISLNSFYCKRYIKIVPFFSLIIFADVIINRTLHSLYEGAMELTMLFGFLPNNELSVIGVAWTLGVIFVFYIAFPFFVFLLWDKKRAWLVLIITLIINFLCTIYFFSDKFVLPNYTARHNFLYCIPFFVCGGLIFLYKEKIESINSKILFVLGFLVTILFFSSPNIVIDIDVKTIKTLILFSVWVMYAISAKNSFLGGKIMAFLSKISLEMYLSHMIIFRILEKLDVLYLFGRGWISFITICILTIIGVIVFIEIYLLFVNKIRKGRMFTYNKHHIK